MLAGGAGFGGFVETAAGVTTATPALWSRNFSLYFGARTVALAGDSMMPVVISIGLLGAGYGAGGVGAALGAWMAASILFMLFGGVLADRFSPRRMMVLADLVRVVTHGIMAFAFISGKPVLWQIICLEIVSGVASAMFQPGTASLIPQVARDVQGANGVLRMSDALSHMTGPALAGVLVVLFGGAGWVIGITSVTFLLSALLLLALRVRPPSAPLVRTSMLRDLAEGWQEFSSRTWLWGVIVIWTVHGLIVFGPSLPLISAITVPRLGESVYGLVMGAFGAGSLVGGLLAMRLRPSRPLAAGAVAMFAFALYPLGPALGFPAPALAASFFAAGIGAAFWGVMWATSVQTQIPAPVLNRVHAYEVTGSNAAIPLGQVLAGPVALVAGVEELLLVGAGVALAVPMLLLSVPAIRNLRRIEFGSAEQEKRERDERDDRDRDGDRPEPVDRAAQ
ncbi:MFS transporter [Rhizohabitans arisaemae]|uniref:MFS transporter n=1 Tax=Rhizohabitans arisaemae TaxID=2720610 RepID=UPI0024B16E56|nr:MFS transporter [Rhizohabitans arisaemae]